MTDEEIKQQLLKQDEGTLREIISLYTTYLTAVCATILTPQHPDRQTEIEEVLQDVFLFIWQSPHKFQPDRSSLKTFLTLKTVSLAKNKITKNYRTLLNQKKFLKHFKLNGTSPTPDHLIEAVVQAILVLAEPTKEILLRRFIFEEPPREIARIMQIETKEIKNRLYYGKKLIRQNISQKGGFERDT